MPFLRNLTLVTNRSSPTSWTLLAELVGERFPVLPIALGAAVLDADDRVLGHELGVEFHQFVAGDGLAGALLEGVGAVAVVELGGGDVQGEEDLLAGLVAGVFDGLQDGFDGVLDAVQLGGEPAFVADGGAQAALLQHAP